MMTFLGISLVLDNTLTSSIGHCKYFRGCCAGHLGTTPAQCAPARPALGMLQHARASGTAHLFAAPDQVLGYCYHGQRSPSLL